MTTSSVACVPRYTLEEDQGLFLAKYFTQTGGVFSTFGVAVDSVRASKPRYVPLHFLSHRGFSIPHRWSTSAVIFPVTFEYTPGTEANNELCSHIPGPACSSTSGNEEAEPGEGHVHIHRGIYGIGELSAVEYDWKTPVAEVFISEPTLV